MIPTDTPESTEFQLLRGDDGRTFLKVFTGQTHIMIELHESERADLRQTLAVPPDRFER